jgi:transmembrane sensor
MEENIPINLIVRYLSNEASTDEQVQLFDWISISAENQKRFNEFCEVWHKNYSHPEDFNEQQALHALNSKIDKLSPPIVERKTNWLKVASVVVVLTLATFSLFVFNLKSVSPEIAYVIKQNPPGQKSHFQLSDGSVVYLNAGSSIRLPEKFSDQTREIELIKGEAFFDVKRDSLRPFIIHTGVVQTKVLGTSFNVSYDEITTEVAVKSGLVQVSNPQKSELITVNEKLTVSENSILRGQADLESILAWRNSTLILDNLSLKDAAAKMEMWYGVKVSFANSAIQQCKISGKYKNQSLENVLKAIAFAIEIEYEIKNKEVKITGKGCQ